MASVPDFTIKANDTLPTMVATLEDANGGVDLSNSTSITLYLKSISGTTSVTASAVAVNPPGKDGIVEVLWVPANTAVPGTYQGEFQVLFSNGAVETFPNSGNLQILIKPDLG